MTPPFAFDAPYNNLSFGNVAISLTREMFKRGVLPAIFPMNGHVDLSAQVPDNNFNQMLGGCIQTAEQRHSRKHPSVRLWHIGSSLTSLSEKGNNLLTFFELDSLTPYEVNILRQQNKIYVTSRYSQTVMNLFGIKADYMPIGFDAHNFRTLEKRRTIDGVTSFLLPGKLERRKSHMQVLRAWAKRYGNNKDYRLNCALHNPFLPPERANAMIAEALEGKPYWNIQFLPFAPDNATYNTTLQSSEIVISMSGGEGRDLPCYHATALGAWPVAMRAHAYLDYLTDENAVLVNPNGKQPAADGVHFAQNGPFNSGNIFSFSDDEFIAACEETEKRVKSLGINKKGLELQNTTYSEAVDMILRDVAT